MVQSEQTIGLSVHKANLKTWLAKDLVIGSVIQGAREHMEVARRISLQQLSKLYQLEGSRVITIVLRAGDLLRRKQLAELLRFPSSKSGDDLISLEQYTERAKESQKSIFYIAADSLAAAASAPFVEQLIKKDLEVGRPSDPKMPAVPHMLPHATEQTRGFSSC